MKVYIGADHGGYELKEKIKLWLTEWKYEWEDCGNTTYQKEDDYPVYAFAVAEKVVHSPDSVGILVCTSAAGMVIAANKVKGIRAALGYSIESTQHLRTHNNVNVLGLSGKWLKDLEIQEIIRVFLTTTFSGEERHVRRINQISAYEKN